MRTRRKLSGGWAAKVAGEVRTRRPRAVRPFQANNDGTRLDLHAASEAEGQGSPDTEASC